MLTVTDNLVVKPGSGGRAKKLVILLHGYGANGDDLLGLGHQWAPHLPDAAFVSPHAPEPCVMNPFGGYQWFDLTMRDPGEYWRGVVKTGPLLEDFIDNQLSAFGLEDKDLALVGFSQGTMIALHVGLRRDKQLAGIIGYSGKLAGPEHLQKEIKSRPPILLTHGSHDDVIPVSALSEATEALKAASVTVDSHVAQGMGHGIDGQGLVLGLQFLQKNFAG